MVLVPEKIPTGMPEPPPRRRHRGWRIALIALASVMAAVLAVSAYGFIRYETRSHPGAKSLGSAVSGFRNSATPSGAAYGMPATGVYELRGQGGERISFPPNSQQDGATMPATVKREPGNCWRWHIDYNTSHAEEFVFCPTASGLAQTTNVNIQDWNYGAFGVSNTSTVACEPGTIVLPPAPTAGQTLTWSCTITSTSLPGTGRSTTKAVIAGVDTMKVGADSVRAAHEVQHTTVTGAQTGTITEDWWFDVASGLPLRVDRQIEIHTDSPLGVITYTESGSWTLVSLTPRT